MSRNKTYCTRLIICSALALLIMGIIFFFSSQNADDSSDISNSVYAIIIDFLGPILTPAAKDFLMHYIRKMAHMSIYFALSICTALCAWNVIRLKLFTGLHTVLTYVSSYVICVLYAMSDEWHQSFTDGRSAEWRDVMIDSSGALLALLLILLIYVISSRKKSVA